MPSSARTKKQVDAVHGPAADVRLLEAAGAEDVAHASQCPSPTTHPATFFFNDTATTEIYTLSLHDALPIRQPRQVRLLDDPRHLLREQLDDAHARDRGRSEEHTSELQSHSDLVCRLLLEKKKKHILQTHIIKKKKT